MFGDGLIFECGYKIANNMFSNQHTDFLPQRNRYLWTLISIICTLFHNKIFDKIYHHILEKIVIEGRVEELADTL
jgi:hypothetical protein